MTLLLLGLAAGCGGRTLVEDIEPADAEMPSFPANIATSGPMMTDAGRMLGRPSTPDGAASCLHGSFSSDAGTFVRTGGRGAPTSAGTLRVGMAVPGPDDGDPGWLLLAVDPSGNILVAGATHDPKIAGVSQFSDFHTSEAFVAKLSPDGTAQWAMPLPSAGQPHGLGVDSKGEIVVLANDRAGTSKIGNGYVTTSLYLAKMATNGALLFDERVDFGPASVDLGGLAVAGDGGFYVAGSLAYGVPQERPFLERYDSAGNRLWSKIYSAGRMAHATAVAAAPNGDAVLTGYFDEWLDLGNGKLTSTAHSGTFSSLNGFIGRYESSGNCGFGARFGGPMFDMGAAVTVDPSNEILLGGAFTGPGIIGGAQVSSNEAAFAAKLDVTGNARWVSLLEGKGNVTRRIVVNGSGEIFVAGQLGGSVYLREVAASVGIFNDRKTSSGTTNTTDVAIGKDGALWIAGTFDKTVDLGQGPIVGGPASYFARLAP
jgi:hypothetical protein